MQIAIISGKGGTGKSSISAAFATLQKQVVLADCDVDAANLHIIFDPEHEEENVFIGARKAVIDQSTCIQCGLCLESCRFDAIHLQNGKIYISENLCDGCRLCKHICPVGAITMMENDRSRIFTGKFRCGQMIYGRLAPGEENSGKMVSLIREKAKAMAEKHKIPIIIIDGSPGIGCPVISAITGVDVVVIVTEPTISGVSDLKRVLEITTKFSLKAKVIINKFDLNLEKSNEIKALCQKSAIPIAGELPYDNLMVDAMVNCKSIPEFAPDSYLSSTLMNIWKKIKAT